MKQSPFLTALTTAALLLPASSDARCCCALYNVKKSPYASIIACQVGDLVTVIVDQEATTTDNGISNTKREHDVEALLNQFFMPLFNPFEGLKKTAGQGDPAEVSYESSNDYRSSAINTATHKIETRIQVRLIEEIRPDEFVVQGYRIININGKEKRIYVSGVVRQWDISPENTISSDAVADARIEIEGEVSTDDLKPNVFSQLLNIIF